MSAAAVIVMRRKKLIKAFREAGAFDRDNAVTLEALRIRKSWIFDQMLRDGAFIATDDDHFYMNEAAATEFMRIRQVRALVFIGIALLVFLVLWLTGLLGR